MLVLLGLLEFRATICRHNKLPIIFSFHISVIDFSGPDDIALAGHQINRVSMAVSLLLLSFSLALFCISYLVARTHCAAGVN